MNRMMEEMCNAYFFIHVYYVFTISIHEFFRWGFTIFFILGHDNKYNAEADNYRCSLLFCNKQFQMIINLRNIKKIDHLNADRIL